MYELVTLSKVNLSQSVLSLEVWCNVIPICIKCYPNSEIDYVTFCLSSRLAVIRFAHIRRQVTVDIVLMYHTNSIIQYSNVLKIFVPFEVQQIM